MICAVRPRDAACSVRYRLDAACYLCVAAEPSLTRTPFRSPQHVLSLPCLEQAHEILSFSRYDRAHRRHHPCQLHHRWWKVTLSHGRPTHLFLPAHQLCLPLHSRRLGPAARVCPGEVQLNRTTDDCALDRCLSKDRGNCAGVHAQHRKTPQRPVHQDRRSTTDWLYGKTAHAWLPVIRRL
jgi:hypothetical protein